MRQNIENYYLVTTVIQNNVPVDLGTFLRRIVVLAISKIVIIQMGQVVGASRGG